MPAAVQVIHRLDRQKDHEVDFGGVLGVHEAQVELAAALDDLLEQLIDRVLVAVGEARDGASNFASNRAPPCRNF